jgi:hypothetical protein
MERMRPRQVQSDRCREVLFLEYGYCKSPLTIFAIYFLERLARSFSDHRAYSASSNLDFDFGT